MSLSQRLAIFLRIFWPPMLVLALHLLRQIVLPTAYDLDMVAHFLGGLSIAWVIANAYSLLREKKILPSLPRWAEWYVLVTGAELIGVLWEFWEFYIESPYLVDLKLQLADTELDLVLDLVGAIVFATIWVWRHAQVSTKTKTR